MLPSFGPRLQVLWDFLGRWVDYAIIVKRDDLLDLNDALQHPGRVVAVDISTDLPEEGDVDLVAPLEGFLEAVSTGNALIVSGEFSTRACLECSRCSSPLEIDIQFEIDEQFPVVGVASSLSSQDFAKVADEEPFPLFDENHLMVEALLRQGLLLAMPVQTLCANGWDQPCPVADAQVEAVRKRVDTGRPEFSKLEELLGANREAEA
jgi:uncharacterized protein